MAFTVATLYSERAMLAEDHPGLFVLSLYLLAAVYARLDEPVARRFAAQAEHVVRPAPATLAMRFASQPWLQRLGIQVRCLDPSRAWL